MCDRKEATQVFVCEGNKQSEREAEKQSEKEHFLFRGAASMKLSLISFDYKDQSVGMWWSGNETQQTNTSYI